MENITLEQFKSTAALREVEVYLERFGGKVKLRELTGEYTIEANKLATVPMPGAENITRMNYAKREMLLIAFALVEPSLGSTLIEKAGNVDVILKLANVDQLLLSKVTDMLPVGMTEEQREILLAETSPSEKLIALGSPHNEVAEYLLDHSDEDLQDIYIVALSGYPSAVTGDMPMSTIKLLAAAAREKEQRLANLIAAAISSN